ncbi:MAG: hypothetical protein C0468_03100 [Planctomyces sp.]|nr:hypothetical protein [Planctomyces sp.]
MARPLSCAAVVLRSAARGRAGRSVPAPSGRSAMHGSISVRAWRAAAGIVGLTLAASWAWAQPAPEPRPAAPAQPAQVVTGTPQPDEDILDAEAPNLIHQRHKHAWGKKHPTEAATAARFLTNRKSQVALPLPAEREAFSFVVFGDRTSGPDDGVNVLADAVRDVNLLEPDMVLTVGDLIQGYNTTTPWLEQMREYKAIMSQLVMPWFPVAGNHDVYWRGPDQPKAQHEENYELHFGPLWYAFEHKNSWFVVLYSDEGDPATGEKGINRPELQRMSQAQFDWLKEILAKAKDADHVFLFLHHPRWLGGNYGSDWDKVHTELVNAGNVTAVFAGHIHRARYDPKDGIEYVTLATTGGSNQGTVPEAGWLHHYHVVTVRPDQVALAAYPVGEVLDVREITGELADQAAEQATVALTPDAPLAFDTSGAVSQRLSLVYPNVTTRPIDLTVTPDSLDPRWVMSPDHNHARVKPGESATFTFDLRRSPGLIDQYLRGAELVINAEVLMPGHRYTLPERRQRVGLDVSRLPQRPAAEPSADTALRLDGDDALLLDGVSLGEGPLTVEAWVRADRFPRRATVVAKGNREMALFAGEGTPGFSLALGQRSVFVRGPERSLTPGAWHHIAGVYDGAEARVYVDGALVGKEPATGARRAGGAPIVVGGDVGRGGAANGDFVGAIDGFRITRAALYSGNSFRPERRPTNVPGTAALSNFDALFADGVWGEGPTMLIAPLVGNATLSPAN